MSKRPVIIGNHAFFFLWPGFIDFFDGFRGFTDIFGSKNWNLGWFHETRQKNKLKLLGHPAGPREVSIFFCLVSWIPTKVFNFLLPKNIREYPWNHQKNQWNPGHKIKKICVVYHEILLWWYFGQEYSYYNLIIQSFTMKISM